MGAMKKKCKDTKAACEAKTNEEEKAKCIKAAMDKAMEEMKGGGGKKPEDGKKPDGAKKPVRKKRPVAQKGTDCTKIPKKADLDKDIVWQTKTGCGLVLKEVSSRSSSAPR